MRHIDIDDFQVAALLSVPQGFSMRILISLTYYLPHVSGITVYNHRLAKALVEADHTVTVLTSQYDQALARDETLDGVRIIRLPVWFWISKGAIMPGFPWAFCRLISRHDVVLMNLPNTPVEAISGPLIARLEGKPLVAKYMCDVRLPFTLFNGLVNTAVHWANLFAVALSDRVISMTRDYAEHSSVLKPFLGKLAVIPPPVCMAAVSRETREAWKTRHNISGSPLIGFAARLSTEKGVEVMLRALQRVMREFPSTTVLFGGDHEAVIGEHAYRERLLPLLKKTSKNWRFLGVVSQDDMPAFYSACDVTVLPSLNSTESFGIVQVESMLCGTPVVASDLPGVRDTIRRTGMGKIVPAGDEAALAGALMDVLRHRDTYVKPREEIVRHFSIARTKSQYERLFRSAINARRIAWTQLRAKPIFLALQRAVEHREVRRQAPFAAPVLDVGAGDGHFGTVVLRGGIDLGIDRDHASLRRARAQRFGSRRGYKLLVRCSAGRIPLAAASVATIISNSTLEHIPELDATLDELFRVLKPGGRLVVTVPTARWNEALFTPKILRKLGLNRAARAYANRFRKIQRHHHLLSPDEWLARVKDAGFEVKEARGYFPAAAVGWLEVLHYEGWHNLLSRALTGRWIFLPWRPLYVIPEGLVAKFAGRKNSKDATCILIDAMKPDTE